MAERLAQTGHGRLMGVPVYGEGVRCRTCGVAAFATNESGLSDYVRDVFAEVHGDHDTETVAATKPDTAGVVG